MQKLNRFFLPLALAVSLGSTAIAQGNAGGTPLMVVRFNQARVYYDQQLYSAVSQAVAVKPEVMFDIVSNAPVTGNAERDQEWVTTASRNTQAVVTTLQSIGVPMERMRISGQARPGIAYDETHIYVR